MITAHVYQRYVRATLDTVWQALVYPSMTSQYFHGTAFTAPPAAGEPFRTTLPDGSTAVDGLILQCTAPHVLSHTWHTRYDPDLEAEPPSRVTWTLTDAGEHIVHLRLVHDQLAFSPLTWANVKDGWVYILDGLKTLVETGTPLPARTRAVEAAPADPEGDWHRRQGVETNNALWALLDADPFDAEEALRTAHTSAYHWQRARDRGPANEIRGAYMIGKVQLTAGHPDLAMSYADRTIADCETHGIADFDLAYAFELRARSLKALGRTADARVAWGAARGVEIADPADAEILARDFADFTI